MGNVINYIKRFLGEMLLKYIIKQHKSLTRVLEKR